MIQDELKLLVVVASELRLRRFRSLLNRPRLERLVVYLPNGLAGAVKFYRVRRPVPVVRSFIPKSGDLREISPCTSPQNTRTTRNPDKFIHNEASHTDKDFWVENGGK